MSATADFSIYAGAWINWSRGSILGATLTLTQRNGSLFTAFLGIFVTIAGGACWRILSFLIHQHRVRYDLKDNLYHQQQVILRNSGSSTGTAWQMIRFAWNNRKLEKKQSLTSLSIIILAMCNTMLFAVAGVFSSSVIKAAGSETLIVSSHCGFLQRNEAQPSFAEVADINRITNDTSDAIMYSRACYDDASNQLQCGRFPRSHLTSTWKMNVSCPFQSKICFEGPNAAFQVTSQWIDTNDDLGINSKKSDRLQYRKVSTCSVLRTLGYVDAGDNPNYGLSGSQEVFFNYGPGPTQNFTYEFPLEHVGGPPSYHLSGVKSAPYPGLGWTPIPELHRTDADVSIIFLEQGNVVYRAPVWDPWFMATNPVSDSPNSTKIGFYVDDQLPHVLACADQFQLCIQAHTKCTPLSGWFPLPDALKVLQLNNVQKNISMLLTNETFYQSTDVIAALHGSSGLRGSDTLSEFGIQVGLPNNQWMIEIAHWFDVSMARLQQQIVKFATGPLNFDKNLTFVPGSKNVCGRQKIRNATGYISFSVLGICIVFSIGGSLLLISLVFDSIMGYFRKTFDWKDYKRLQWANDEQLELQRLAYSREGQEGSEGKSGLQISDNVDSSTSEGNASPQTSEGNQANEVNSLQVNEGTDTPTSGGDAGPISEGDAGPQTIDDNAGSSISDGSARLPTNEENARPQSSKWNAGLEAEGDTGLQAEGDTGLQAEGDTGLQAEGNTGLQAEGDTGLQAEGNPGLQAEGNTGLQANEGTGTPTSQEYASPKSEGFVNSPTSEENAASRISEGNTVFSTHT